MKRVSYHQRTSFAFLVVLMASSFTSRAAAKLFAPTSLQILHNVSVGGRINLSNVRGLSRIRHVPQSVLDVIMSDGYRGGDQSSGYDNHLTNQSSYSMNTNMNPNGSASQQTVDQGISSSQMQHPNYQQSFAQGEGEFAGGYNPNEQVYGQRESMEDRLAAWRLQQQVCSSTIYARSCDIETG